MSVPPPSSAPPGGGLRETIIRLEGHSAAEDALRLSAMGATLTHGRKLAEPLRLPLGTLQLGLIDRGPAAAGRLEGRFPVLRRLSPTAVLPREEGVEGWLWTSTGGSALTVLGDDDEAPNAALLFTKPLGEDVVARAFRPEVVTEIAARSPLGAPTIYGLLFRVADQTLAESTFRQYRLLKPLTDREVPPTLRRALPTDRPADPVVRLGAGGTSQSASATSTAPPGGAASVR